MRFTSFILSSTLILAACNSNTKTIEASSEPLKDSSAMVQPANVSEVQENVSDGKEEHTSATTEKKTTSRETSSSSNTSSSNNTINSESENSAKAKKGWSKTAKGAVIGGVVGAGTGAVVNKKNRAAGAVVGGVVGAGAGAIIGNEMDKKDGRH